MDIAAERKRLLERDAAWSSLSKQGQDIESILSYWSDDAVVYPPGMPAVIRKIALREYVTASFAIPGFSIQWQADDAALSDDATMAYTTGTNMVSLTGQDGASATQPDRFVAVWRRGSDGDWHCVVDVLIPAQ